MTYKIICSDCARKFDLYDEFIRSDLSYMAGLGTFCSFCREEKGGRSITVSGDSFEYGDVSIPNTSQSSQKTKK